MSDKQDAIKLVRIIMKKKFGITIPNSVLSATYDMTHKFAKDPGNRQTPPSKLVKEMTIGKKVGMIADRLSKRFSNVA